mmetsp:Transcript_40389/g.97504  ORF Transcript_40389/g.97504 Transcript_40389/m.97504 type:complete len:489 (+) Transcript_40389:237-1703(+)|eukprot:CAMPEP_0113625978 /NCGR_PEP_ID=MMETSP0017_2-20120614/13427_1 /TAXON_ID=2856 /ORGANISM="Cylindrotheca closterium" /LENGTH=488 /DNA_ID=CAMNT_0000536127 /DNA_START=209 /DNA_END=1675 /DNA_ORIENTATION=+ /assembly_acc=CAM_ASM_000147
MITGQSFPLLLALLAFLIAQDQLLLVVEAYNHVKPSIHKDAEEYTDTHDAVKFHGDKKLYFFAGPHKSASTSVKKFFASWAKEGKVANHPHTLALQYWRWPTFDESAGDKQYNKLVKKMKDDKSYLNKALDEIQKQFDDSDNGVFLGTEEFDQVGPDKYLDAMPVMEAIVDKLQVDHKDIKVIINYRTPRLDQWISVWSHAGEEYAGASYQDFMCEAHGNEEDKKYRFSMIGAEMNPLKAASMFLERGWEVALMDMGGVEKAGKHIVHTIGCDVLFGACDAGVLHGLGEYLPVKNQAQKDFNELNEEESAKIEKLFRYRDCAYQSDLQTYIDKGQLDIQYQDSLWADCEQSQGGDYYEKFKDNTQMMYNALLGQLECKDAPHDLQVGADMDAALSSVGAASGGIGGVFNFLFFFMVLVVAIGVAAFQVLQQRSKERQEILAAGGDIIDDDEGHDDDEPAKNTEMTNVGGFRDDVELDDEEVSDQHSTD